MKVVEKSFFCKFRCMRWYMTNLVYLCYTEKSRIKLYTDLFICYDGIGQTGIHLGAVHHYLSRGLNATWTFFISLAMASAHIILLFRISCYSASSTVFGHSIPNLYVRFMYLALRFFTRAIMTSHFFNIYGTHQLKPGS